MTFETFDLSVFIEADETKIADAWLKSGIQEQWFLARSNYVDPSGGARADDESSDSGDSYWWEWFDGTVETGAVNLAGTNIIEFSFGDGVQVTVQWESVHDGTQVVLSQTHDIADIENLQRVYCSCFQGWTFYLANLKAFLEHGVDLREKAPTRTDHVNV